MTQGNYIITQYSVQNERRSLVVTNSKIYNIEVTNKGLLLNFKSCRLLRQVISTLRKFKS